jgi:hypothetical protein
VRRRTKANVDEGFGTGSWRGEWDPMQTLGNASGEASQIGSLTGGPVNFQKTPMCGLLREAVIRVNRNAALSTGWSTSVSN